MKKLITGILGTLVAIGLMAPTGGFPSRPVFNAVAIGPGTAVGAAGTLTTSNSVTIGGNLSIPTGVARLSCSGVLSDPLTVCSSSDHTTKWLTVSTTSGGVLAGAPTGGDKGLGTVNATGLFVNGVAVPTLRFSYGGCSAISTILATVQNSNLASCTGAAGSVVVVFTTAYTTTAPACTVTINSIPGGATNFGVGAFIQAQSTTGMTVQTYENTTATPLIATPFQFICTGT